MQIEGRCDGYCESEYPSDRGYAEESDEVCEILCRYLVHASATPLTPYVVVPDECCLVSISDRATVDLSYKTGQAKITSVLHSCRIMNLAFVERSSAKTTGDAILVFCWPNVEFPARREYPSVSQVTCRSTMDILRLESMPRVCVFGTTVSGLRVIDR